MKEIRKPLEHKLVETKLYEALLGYSKKSGNCTIFKENIVLTKENTRQLELAINVYLKDSNYQLLKVEEVIRPQIKIGE